MNIGRERSTGRIVTATAAAKNPYRQFVCPICAGSLVYHAVSNYRVAFFGHRPHQAEPNCPLYFAPYDTDVERVVNERAYRVREPALRLQMLNRKSNGYCWQACILVPRFERATSFSIESSSIYGRVSVSAIKEGGSPFSVMVQQTSYAITVFEPDQPPERIAIEGFAPITLFRLSAHLCSRLEQSDCLTAGNAYVVIHPESAKLAPARGLVVTEPLLANDGWSGFAFVLPASPTPDIVEWAASKLKRRINGDDFSASVVAPTDAFLLNDGTWSVSTPAPSITLALAFGANLPRSLTIVHHTVGEAQTVNLFGERNTILQIPNPHLGLYQIKRADTGSVLMTITVVQPEREAKQTGVDFIFSVNGRIEKESLWSAELAQRLYGVSIGLANLVDISIPPGVRVSFFSGAGNKERPQLIESGESFEQREAAGTALRRVLERVLQDARPTFRIDAGGFGVLAFPNRESDQRREPMGIRPALAARRKWIDLATPPLVRSNAARIGDEVLGLRAHMRQLALSCGGIRT